MKEFRALGHSFAEGREILVKTCPGKSVPGLTWFKENMQTENQNDEENKSKAA